MELTAVIQSLHYLSSHPEIFTSSVMIYTDSKYVQKGITEWMILWKKNGWQTSQRKPVQNQDLWQELDHLVSSALHPIQFQHVYAHGDDPYNNLVDRLARG